MIGYRAANRRVTITPAVRLARPMATAFQSGCRSWAAAHLSGERVQSSAPVRAHWDGLDERVQGLAVEEPTAYTTVTVASGSVRSTVRSPGWSFRPRRRRR